jgi:hypothetical protein
MSMLVLAVETRDLSWLSAFRLLPDKDAAGSKMSLLVTVLHFAGHALPSGCATCTSIAATFGEEQESGGHLQLLFSITLDVVRTIGDGCCCCFCKLETLFSP